MTWPEALILLGLLATSTTGWVISRDGVWDKNLEHPRWWQMYLGVFMGVYAGLAFVLLSAWSIFCMVVIGHG